MKRSISAAQLEALRHCKRAARVHLRRAWKNVTLAKRIIGVTGDDDVRAGNMFAPTNRVVDAIEGDGSIAEMLKLLRIRVRR